MTAESPRPVAPHRERREAALSRMGAGVLVLPAAPVAFRSRDTEYRYRPDSELFYLTGVTEPEAVAVLVGGAEPRFELFVRARDPEAELWAGPRVGPEGAAELYGPDACHPIGELEARLPTLLDAGDRIFYRPRAGDHVGTLVEEALAQGRARGARRGDRPRGRIDPGEILDDLRLVKDAHEVECIRRAVEATLVGHRAGAAAIAPGVPERVVEAALDGGFRVAGASGPGFPTIVGAGGNGCVLHYVANESDIGEGDLVLVDAGAEVGLYNGDVTRTYPASGRWTAEQRAVYEVVDAARAAGIAATRPGATIAAVHAAATGEIVRGLIDLGLLSGAPEELIEERAHEAFFPHRTSHWLGLDVHDVGEYARGDESRTLEPGMVFTVEPGLYFRPELTPRDRTAFAGLGIRIEDDVLVTAGGCEVLTADLPTDPDAVAAMVGTGLGAA